MRFDGIQILRAIAANAVVLRHVQAIEQKFTQGQGFLPEWFEWLGVLGVDVFFVISGFVIIKAATRENWREFIFARITRIYPTYWVYTTIFVAIYFAVPSSMSDRSGVSLIGSYLLWPTNGGTFLAVGWTLIHEMYFYLVVTAMLAIRAPAAWMLLAWGVVIALSPLVVNPNNQIEYVVFNPLTFLFILGGFLGLLKTSVVPTKYGSAAGRLAVLLGDASYSTYLGHVLVVSAIWRVAYFFPIHPSALLIALSIIGANAVGVVSFRWIERSILKLAKSQRSRMLGWFEFSQ